MTPSHLNEGVPMPNKTELHPRNQHSEGYDFARLVVDLPELEAFTTQNPVGLTTIDFQDARAVRMLNRALLKTHYNIEFWDIPPNYLCPPIPGPCGLHSLPRGFAWRQHQAGHSTRE